MTKVHFSVHVDYGQYYIEDGGGSFDYSSVDDAVDGVVGPGTTGARIICAVQWGWVDVTVEVVDEPLTLPLPPGRIASAFSLELPSGALVVSDWAGPRRFTHDFGQPTNGAALVEVENRDLAREAFQQARRRAAEGMSDKDSQVKEHHMITISPAPIPMGRWRSAAMDVVGSYMETFTAHIDGRNDTGASTGHV